jgi:hypothetical protein
MKKAIPFDASSSAKVEVLAPGWGSPHLGAFIKVKELWLTK